LFLIVVVTDYDERSSYIAIAGDKIDDRHLVSV